MKKLLISLAVFSICLFLASCGDSGNDNSNEGGNNQDNTDTAGETDTDSSDTGSNTENPDTATDTASETETDTDSSDTGSSTEDPADTDTAPVDENSCSNEGEIRVGDTTCPDNPKGLLYQKCDNGSWVDTADCILCDPGDYPKVCGTYAQKMWFTSQSKVYSINAAEGWTRTYFLIFQEQEQEKVHIKATYCKIKIDNDARQFLQVDMPQSFADALGTTDKESVLSKRDDGTIGFDQAWLYEMRGIDPTCYGDDPEGYTLPTDSTDPCVQDWDQDDMPGLTVKANGTLAGVNGKMNMVEKAASMIHDGLVSGDGRTINALVDWTDKQSILWATNGVLEKGAENNQKNASNQPDFAGPLFNFIEQFKIPEGSDCSFIVDNAATIFSPDPVVLQ